jgi:uncharacterized protein
MAKPSAAGKSSQKRPPLFEVRHSLIHGYGVFALRKIRKGTRVLEYLGERVSHEIADSRHENKDANDNHTFLFTVDRRTVIDGGVDGNEGRYINHACAPNCESVITSRRVFIDAIKTIRPGDELSYDYLIQRDADDEPDVDVVFGCRCGADSCRGSMLEPKKIPRRRQPARRKAALKSAARKSPRKSAGRVAPLRKPAARKRRRAKARGR